MIFLVKNLSELFAKFLTIGNGLLDVVFHVELHEVVLPHENVGSLIDVWIERHSSILSDFDAFLESVFDGGNVALYDLQ